jgi:hypothetical protein
MTMSVVASAGCEGDLLPPGCMCHGWVGGLCAVQLAGCVLRWYHVGPCGGLHCTVSTADVACMDVTCGGWQRPEAGGFVL